MQTTETLTPPPSPPPGFFLTESAAARINHLKNKNGKPGMRFRITVKGGGCSGFQYEFALDDAPLSDVDSVFSLSGADVVIDDISLGLVSGSTVDFVEDLSQAG
ncbi:MAG: iron-sulfur cluster assembly accessory protein, partial [Rickettsiales bacterium]|nr:iron-sulfur cluster assembly accessory protein [Rickettsiales bacterium]